MWVRGVKVTTKPLVSVVIPVFNGEPYLASTIESVLAQTYHPLEVIVVEDGSADGSADIVKKYQEVCYFHQPNRGVAAARNVGIGRACGEFIAPLDQDDVWYPDAVEVMADALLGHPEAGYVIARQEFFLEAGEAKPPWLKVELLHGDHPCFGPGGVMIRRAVLETLGGFNPDFVTASDVEWFFRAKDAGIGMLAIPRLVLRKRIHAANQSRQVSDLHGEYLRVARLSMQRMKGGRRFHR
jgi:glycosyltransferase involved in cell wall biosynthesis